MIDILPEPSERSPAAVRVRPGASLEDTYAALAPELVRLASTLLSADDAADAVAGVFVRLLAAPSRWAAVEDPGPYLRRSVMHEAMSIRRTFARRRAVNERLEGRTSADDRRVVDPDPSGFAAMVAGLPRQQRAVVGLAYGADLTAPEIADVLAVSEGTVRKQLARARQRLRAESPEADE